MWFTGEDVSLLSVEGDGVEGSCLRVENISINDARWAQVVEVKPNTILPLQRHGARRGDRP